MTLGTWETLNIFVVMFATTLAHILVGSLSSVISAIFNKFFGDESALTKVKPSKVVRLIQKQGAKKPSKGKK